MANHTYFIACTQNKGAVSRHFMALARELRRRANKVLVIVPPRPVPRKEEGLEHCVSHWPSKRPTSLRDARFLYELIRRHRPDCLIATFGAVNVSMFVGALARVPCRIAWYRTMEGQIAADSETPRWTSTLHRWRKRLVYAAATNLIANSHAAGRDLKEGFHIRDAKCTVFYNSLLDPLASRAVAPQPPTEPRVACVGRLFPSKGQDLLIHAIAVLKQEHPRLNVRFIGDGPNRAGYIALAKRMGVADHCSFLGSLPHSRALHEMASATVTVVPSRMEAFGWVNIESLALGTPVVATSVGGIPEIVRDGLDGFLVPKDDSAALAAKLSAIISDHSLRERMSQHARERFLTIFEQRANVDEQVRWLERTVESNAAVIAGSVLQPQPGGLPCGGRSPTCLSFEGEGPNDTVL